MAENTDAMAAAMAETVKNPEPATRRCDCCGTLYTSPEKARFSLLTTGQMRRRVCGDCIQFLWRERGWGYDPNDELTKKGGWLKRWLRRHQ